MNTQTELTQDYLKSILDYEPTTGRFRWKESRRGVKAGNIAGGINSNLYRLIKINFKSYKAHRLAWLYVYGHMPEFIDHINGKKTDNRIENLRECTKRQNGLNQKVRSDSKTNVKGVSWHSTNKKYRAQLKVDGKIKHLGYFNDVESAEKAMIEARNKYHKEFANHG